ncbi:MAG: prepilin-type N-terminal cleavage/methylation domain-containing protein [Candidatus Pacebacteria bacterium]|nr:prepilin-type N-terminal cleavage/methylation domain-containing protein [Candidatus Paceibacterota bacterium]
MIGIKKNKQFGFSLMETLIATTIFVVVILLVSQIFIMVIDSADKIHKNFVLQESLKLFTETAFRDLRMARLESGEDYVFSNYRFDESFSVNSGITYMSAYNRRCNIGLVYDEDTGVNRVAMRNGLFNGSEYFLTPAKINIEYLRFVIDEDVVGGERQQQPRVTILVRAKTNTGSDESSLILQTTISSRMYDE